MQAKPLQYQTWKQAVNQNLRDCELYTASVKLWSKDARIRSFVGNAFRAGTHPAVFALDFAAFVGEI